MAKKSKALDDLKKALKDAIDEGAAKNSNAVNPKLKRQLEKVVTTKPADNGNAGGLFTIVALLAVLGYLVHRVGGFDLMWADMPVFFSGQALQLWGKHNDIFATSVTVILVEVLLSFAILILMGVTGQTKTEGEHAVANMMHNMQVSHHFLGMLFMVIVEEAFARWFFLGVLRHIPGLGGPIAFWGLLLLGNGLWALIHLPNFKNEEDRKLIKVLPQFVSGLLFSYIYVKYGFLMAVIVHMGCNSVLFTLHKVEVFGWVDAIGFLYMAAVAAIAYENIGFPLSDMLAWVNSPEAGGRPVALEGWGFWNYFAASLALSYGVNGIAGLMLFDGNGKKKEEKKTSTNDAPFAVYIGVAALLLAAFLGAIYLEYWFMGLFFDEFYLRAVAVALTLACLHTGRSGSSIARTFWVLVPLTYVSVCIIVVLGFWQAAASISLAMLIGLPVVLINHVKYQLQD
jgi:hypothetical protein